MGVESWRTHSALRSKYDRHDSRKRKARDVKFVIGLLVFAFLAVVWTSSQPSHALPGAGQRAVLRHDAEALAEVRERALADVRAVQEHAPVVGVVEAEEQLQQRGPPGPVQGDGLTREPYRQ